MATYEHHPPFFPPGDLHGAKTARFGAWMAEALSFGHFQPQICSSQGHPKEGISFCHNRQITEKAEWQKAEDLLPNSVSDGNSRKVKSRRSSG